MTNIALKKESDLAEIGDHNPTIFVSDLKIEIDFKKGAELNKEDLRRYITELEEKLLTLPQTEIPLKHYFSKGVYGREIKTPAGSLIVGKIHKHQTMNVLSAGEVSVLSTDGVIRIKAPFTFVSNPGVKRVIYSHSDSVWSTFHGTDETDIEKIEKQFIADSYDDVVTLVNKIEES